LVAHINNAGIKLYVGCDYNIIKNSQISYTDHGIVIEGTSTYDCTDNEIFNNIIFDNTYNGIRLEKVSFNYIYRNRIYATYGQQEYGIHLIQSDSNQIYHHHSDRYINSEQCGIYDHWFSGIYLEDDSDNNIIWGNTIKENNEYGVKIKDSNSDNNDVFNNNFLYNNMGGLQGYDDSGEGDNSWSQPYLNPPILGSCGNFWSENYDTTDNYYGPNQDQEGSDGICDSSYTFTSPHPFDTTDYYPFVDEISNPDPPDPPE